MSDINEICPNCNVSRQFYKMTGAEWLGVTVGNSLTGTLKLGAKFFINPKEVFNNVIKGVEDSLETAASPFSGTRIALIYRCLHCRHSAYRCPHCNRMSEWRLGLERQVTNCPNCKRHVLIHPRRY